MSARVFSRGGRMPRLLVLAVIAVGFGWSFAAAPALADATINVNTTADETSAGDGTCSLREAILFANGSAEPDCAPGVGSGTTTINLPASSSHYFLTAGQLEIVSGATVVIKGGGVGALGTTIDAAHNSRVLFLGADANGTVSELTIENGVSDGGGGILNSGTLTLNAVTVSNSTVSAAPVGNQCAKAPHGGNGGGIANGIGATLTLNGSSVVGNSAADGGAAGAGSCGVGAGGDGGNGGGIFNQGTVSVNDSTISANSAGNGGEPGCSRTFGGAGGGGGGVLSLGPLTVTDSTISGNNAGRGGCSDNGGNGGGIASVGSSLTLVGSTVSGNRAGPAGDGPPPFASIPGSGGFGGGIYSSGPFSALNSTVANNATGAGGAGDAFHTGGNGGSGGGIVQDGSSAAITNLTIAFNNTGAGGSGGQGDGASGAGTGIDTIHGGSIDEANTLVSGTCAGTITSTGPDLADTGSCPANIHGPPFLSPLASNGGPTETMSIPATSPAVDQVPATPMSCPATDQRGYIRPDGESTCDIGAYESGAVPPLVLHLHLTAGLGLQPHFFGLRLHGTEKQGATVVSVLHKPRVLVLLVRRIVRHHRLILVGLVRLGPHRKGRSQGHWNLRVNGRLLPAGSYQVVMYALDRGNVLSLPAKPGARTLTVLKDGRVKMGR